MCLRSEGYRKSGLRGNFCNVDVELNNYDAGCGAKVSLWNGKNAVRAVSNFVENRRFMNVRG